MEMKEDFERFFTENVPRVRAYAMQVLMSEEDAEDVAQDVFLKLMAKPEVWKDEERKDGYLFKTTKNHILNFIKRRKIERNCQQRLSETNASLVEEFGLEDRLHAQEVEFLIMSILQRMPERRSDIFKMSRYEGKSNQEIADLLNISIRTVERHIYLALADLKETLNLYLVVE
jgi:RNA polymerase sigma-70 factor (ECF subfamily)